MYKQAIDIVSTDQDWKRIVLDIAKAHPSVIVEVFDKRSCKPKAKGISANEALVAAIKYCRKETGMCLVDAKNAVEAL